MKAMARIYNFKKHDWDSVRNTITDEKHLRAYDSILIEFKRLYELHRSTNWPEQASYERLDELQFHLDTYRKAYKTQ